MFCAVQPRSLTAAKLGVGACAWDGALVLCSYLAAQPRGTFAGKPGQLSDTSDLHAWHLGQAKVSPRSVIVLPIIVALQQGPPPLCAAPYTCCLSLPGQAIPVLRVPIWQMLSSV